MAKVPARYKLVDFGVLVYVVYLETECGECRDRHRTENRYNLA